MHSTQGRNPTYTPPQPHCLVFYTISYRSTVKIFSIENSASSPPATKFALATSTFANDPAATKPTLTGKKASASPSHLNSSEPVGSSDEIEGIVHWNEDDEADQSASGVETDGVEWCLIVVSL